MSIVYIIGAFATTVAVLCFGAQTNRTAAMLERVKAAVQSNTIRFAYVAQITANSCFGVGAVVGKLGLPSVNPLMFATCRECGASILLVLAAWHVHGFHAPTLNSSSSGNGNGSSRARGTLPLAILCGFSVLSGQLLFLVGLKMSNPVSASVWQPSQPIFTLLMAVALGEEKLTGRKLGGIVLAFIGCLYMVLSGSSSSSSHQSNGSDGAGDAAPTHYSAWLPHLFFFFNCLGTPVYILASKRLMKTMPPLWVTAWSYITASVMLLFLTIAGNSVKPVLDFMCPPPDQLCGNGWQIPPGALWALAYWIVFVSALAYALITWGNQHIAGSTVSAFFAFQPIASATAASLVVKLSAPPHYGLAYPGVEHVAGAVGVLGGLWLIISEASTSTKSTKRSHRDTHQLQNGGAESSDSSGGSGDDT